MNPIIEHNVYTLLDFLVYGPRVAIVLLVLLACWPANAHSKLPPRWWTDQDDKTARCNRYPQDANYDRLRADCIRRVKR
jgi:hypothetical protein